MRGQNDGRRKRPRPYRCELGKGQNGPGRRKRPHHSSTPPPPLQEGNVATTPNYAPARRKRRVEGLVQPLLFDFPREEKAVGANKIGPASSPRSYLHVIPSSSDDN